MKIHAKKKAYRHWVHLQARAGRINDERGVMVPRGLVADSSMKRDYYPQRSK